MPGRAPQLALWTQSPLLHSLLSLQSPSHLSPLPHAVPFLTWEQQQRWWEWGCPGHKALVLGAGGRGHAGAGRGTQGLLLLGCSSTLERDKIRKARAWVGEWEAWGWADSVVRRKLGPLAAGMNLDPAQHMAPRSLERLLLSSVPSCPFPCMACLWGRSCKGQEATVVGSRQPTLSVLSPSVRCL